MSVTRARDQGRGVGALVVELRLAGTISGSDVSVRWAPSLSPVEEAVAGIVRAVCDVAGAPAGYGLLTAAWESLERHAGIR
jgi:hypothetical protein